MEAAAAAAAAEVLRMEVASRVAADEVLQNEGKTRAAATGLASAEATTAEAIREVREIHGPSPPSIDKPVSAAINGSEDAAALAAANAAVTVAEDSSGDAAALAAAHAPVSAVSDGSDDAAALAAATAAISVALQRASTALAEARGPAARATAAPRQQQHGSLGLEAEPMAAEAGSSEASVREAVAGTVPSFVVTSQAAAETPAPKHRSEEGCNDATSLVLGRNQQLQQSQSHPAFPAPSRPQSSPQPQDVPQGQLRSQPPSKGPQPLAVPQLRNPSQPQPQPQPHTYYQSYQQHKAHQQQQQRQSQQPKEMPPWLRANDQQRHPPPPRRPPSPARGRAAQLPSGPARRSVSSGPAMMAAGRSSSLGGGSGAEPPLLFPGGRGLALGRVAAASPFLSPGRLRAPPLAQSPSVRPAAEVDTSWSGRNSLGGGPARFTSPSRHSSAESAHFISPSKHSSSSSWQQQAGTRSSAATARPASADSLGGGSACFMSPSMHSSVWQQQQQLGTHSESAAGGRAGGPAAARGGAPPTVSSAAEGEVGGPAAAEAPHHSLSSHPVGARAPPIISSEPALWVTEQSHPGPEVMMTRNSCSLEGRLDDDETGSSRIEAVTEVVTVTMPHVKLHHSGVEVCGSSGVAAPRASCSDPHPDDGEAGSVSDATATAAMTPAAPQHKPCFAPQQQQLRSPQLNLLRSVGSKQLLQVRGVGLRDVGAGLG